MPQILGRRGQCPATLDNKDAPGGQRHAVHGARPHGPPIPRPQPRNLTAVHGRQGLATLLDAVGESVPAGDQRLDLQELRPQVGQRLDQLVRQPRLARAGHAVHSHDQPAGRKHLRLRGAQGGAHCPPQDRRRVPGRDPLCWSHGPRLEGVGAARCRLRAR